MTMTPDDESTNWQDYRVDTREMFRVYGWVWDQLLSPLARKNFKWVTASIVGTSSLGLTYAWIIGHIVDTTNRHDLPGSMTWLASLGGILAVKQGLRWAEGRRREIILGESVVSIDDRTNRLFMEKSLGQHLNEHGQLSAANVEKGRSRALEIVNLLCFEGIDAFVTMAVAFIFVVAKFPFAAVGVIVFFIISITWSMFLNKRAAQFCVPLDAQFRARHRRMVERQEGIERVKANGKEVEESDHLHGWHRELLQEDRRFWLWFIDQCNLRGLVNNSILVGIVGWGMWRVHQDSLSSGDLIPLFVWVQLLVENAWRIGSIEHRVTWSLPSIRSMMEVLTIPPNVTDAPDAVELEAKEGIHIAFNQVSYSFPDKESSVLRPVLSNVSFEIKSGEAVALLGPSGAGKSTILRLLQRGMDTDDGSIQINGIDLRQLKLQSWLGLTSHIAQSAKVYDGTMRSNVVYGLPASERDSLPDDHVWDFLRSARADFDGRLTKGLETQVGRNGVQLSGGEAQRLMVAAALAKRPRILLVDEATSSLDSETELHVQDGINAAIRSGSGAVIIAHRLSTVRNCHRFIVLKSATQLAPGESQVEAIASSFEELYSISPTFRRLADAQGISISN